MLLLVMAVGLAACGDAGGTGDSTSPPTQPPAATSAPVDTPTTEAVLPTADGWSTFTAEADGFSVEMPGEPQYITRTMDSALGELTFHFFQITVGTAYYAVTYNDYPIDMAEEDLDPDSFLDDAITSAGGGGEAQNVRRIEVQGNPAIEGEIAAQESTHMWYRGVQVNRRLYQLIAATPEGDKDAFAGDAARFINSFTLLNP
jgi:hypothetical protein